MSEEIRDKKNRNWLYAVIALLVFGLAFETAFLIRQLAIQKKSRAEESVAASYPTTPRPQRTGAYSRPRAAWNEPFGEDLFENLRHMQDRMNRLMNTALTYGPPIANSLGQQDGFFDFSPAIDLNETEQAYLVRCDLPGLDKDKINITVQNNSMTLQGIRENQNETKDEKSGHYAQERSYGSFARSISLPGPVDESRINAEYKNGVLTVTLPKAGETKTTKKVAIQ